jgi:hypothetical protein
MIVASFQTYLPISDLLKIIAVCVAVAVVAPSAAALVITGFEAQASAHRTGGTRMAGDLRIALGGVLIAAMIVVGIVAMTKK